MLIKGNFFYICDKELKAVETLLELSKKKNYGFLTITKFITNMTKTERNSHRTGGRCRLSSSSQPTHVPQLGEDRKEIL